MKKTNAARILDRYKITYSLVSYPVDESDLSGMHVAQTLGVAPEQMFKTLVLTDEVGRPLVACIAVDAALDLKALARAAGIKRCTLLPAKDLQRVTGYLRGGCSPVGMKKSFPTFVDVSVRHRGTIYISAGVRGAQIRVAASPLIGMLKAKVVPIVQSH